MAEDKNAETNGAATDNGGNATGGTAGATDERANWTRTDWERHVQRESDRRVTDALTKKEAEYKALLTDTKTTADEKLKQYEAQLSSERMRAEFMAAANAKGITDPRAAYAVVKEYGLADDRGRVNFDKLKSEHPLLFAASGSTRSVAGAAGDIGQNFDTPKTLGGALKVAMQKKQVKD
jgi:hypothetical protein